VAERQVNILQADKQDEKIDKQTNSQTNLALNFPNFNIRQNSGFSDLVVRAPSACLNT